MLGEVRLMEISAIFRRNPSHSLIVSRVAKTATDLSVCGRGGGLRDERIVKGCKNGS